MPFTIHAAWFPSRDKHPDGQLFIWAEDHTYEPGIESGPENVAETGHTPVNGRTNGAARVRMPKLPSHPGQMAVGRLRSVVRQLATEDEIDSQPASANVWLPSLGKRPQSRRSGVNRGQGAGIEPELPILSPWQVTGLTLDPFHTLTFLSRLAPPQSAKGALPLSQLRHFHYGNDLLFWSHAAKYVLEVLAGQHFLPSIQTDSSGRFFARWTPSLPDGQLRQRVENLVDVMPPICRAYNLASVDEAPSGDMLVEHFFGTLCDRAIRAWSTPPAIDFDSPPPRRWLHSLLSDRPQMELPPQPAHDLFQSWASWNEQLHASAADINFHVAFKLEPEAGVVDKDRDDRGDSWLLQYYLQAKDDPSVLVSAQELWSNPGQSLRVEGLRFEQPQERLLAGLTIASRIFPVISESMRISRPEMVRLNTEQAYQFLKEIGPLLESSGFGVILPEWWQMRKRSRLGLRLRLQSGEAGAQLDRDGMDSTSGSLSLSSLIGYRWELTLGEEVLDRNEFDTLVSRESPLVNVRGRWVELDPQQVQAARQFLVENPTEGRMGLLEAVRMAQAYATPPPTETAEEDLSALLEETEGELLPLDTVEVEGWLDRALSRLRNDDAIVEIDEPDGFVGTLRPYQRRGVGWLWFLRRLGIGACLADDMGLGKTIQAIGLLLLTRKQALSEGLPAPHSLLICPTSVVSNWRHEMERFAPGMRALVHHGSGRLSGDEFVAALEEYDLIITSYGTARRDIDMLESIDWSELILDEAQNIKNPTAKQTQAVRRIQARNRIALTGTPVENRLLELWSIMEFLNPGYLGSRDEFRQRYVLPIERYNDEIAAQELRRIVQPFLLRRLKTDPSIITDLPEKNEMIVYCPLSEEQATLYNRVMQETMERVEQSEGIQRRGLVLSLLLKLKQVCNHPAHYLREKEPLKGRSGKLQRITEMLEEALSVGDRALVFTQFVEMGHLLQKHLQERLGQEVLFLHGGTPAHQRDQMVRYFQEEKEGAPIFILSLRAGGVGLNLTRANHVFHFDRWWNPAVENQATDRAFRIGQRRAVHVFKFVVAGTLEERIHEMIESKQNLAQSIVGNGEDWLAELDSGELRQMLALRREEVEDVEEEVLD